MRGYVNSGIQLKANKQYNGDVVEPNQDDDDGCQTAVEFVVIGEVDEEDVFDHFNLLGDFEQQLGLDIDIEALGLCLGLLELMVERQ